MDSDCEDHLNNLLEYGYFSLFNKITRPNDNDMPIGTCIDNMFLKTNINEFYSMKLLKVIPDHYPLFMSINIQKNDV